MDTTASDLSPELLQIAVERARDCGVPNFTTQPSEAQALAFADNRFDLATCCFGVMFFADVECALGELRRVLKPGARACFAVWGPQDQPYFATWFGVVHRHLEVRCWRPAAPIHAASPVRAVFPKRSKRAGLPRARKK